MTERAGGKTYISAPVGHLYKSCMHNSMDLLISSIEQTWGWEDDYS
jgi:hypothetical protein